MNPLIRRLGQLTILPKINAYQVHTNAQIVEAGQEVQNRNPRNLELLRIARKPAGYHLEKAGREYWHKLVVTKKSRYVIADIVHWENKTVITASTNEWAIKKQLYKLQDRAAYLNLGRVMALRCLESGIVNVRCDVQPSECEKLQLFLTEMVNGGIVLQEPSRYINSGPWDQHRYEKSWEVQE